METAVAITDRMKYGVKPSAVRSENYLHNIKASNGPVSYTHLTLPTNREV